MRLSKEKIEKISEQILGFLYSKSPQALFTYNIATDLARDEEFVKRLLKDLKQKGLVLEIKKNPKGIAYSRRSRWRLSEQAYHTYKNHQ